MVVAWAKTVYVAQDKTTELLPDMEASLQRVARALDCDNIKFAPLQPPLEHLLGSSVKVESGDDGRLLVKPLLGLLS